MGRRRLEESNGKVRRFIIYFIKGIHIFCCSVDGKKAILCVYKERIFKASEQKGGTRRRSKSVLVIHIFIY